MQLFIKQHTLPPQTTGPRKLATFTFKATIMREREQETRTITYKHRQKCNGNTIVYAHKRHHTHWPWLIYREI